MYRRKVSHRSVKNENLLYENIWDKYQMTAINKILFSVTQSCLTLFNLVDCNPQGSSVHGIFFKFYFIFKLYIIVLVLPNIKMNPPQVYMCSPSWTLLPPPSPYPPSGSSQCTSPKHPASCIEPGLATRFIHDILHVSMPFSQIFPPSPSPTEFIRLFYTSVGFFRQECQSVFAIPPPGHLPDPETKPAFPMSPALAGRFFTTEPLGKLLTKYYSRIIFK